MKRNVLIVTSNKFESGGTMPVRYTCDGKNVNPPMTIKNLPEKAKSIAIIMEDKESDDYDAIHWLAYNIPASGYINEDEKECDTGLNGFNGKGYVGPCPSEDVQRYVFRVYALDDYLYFGHDHVSRMDVEEGIRYHLVGYGELGGKYQKDGKFDLVKIA